MKIEEMTMDQLMERRVAIATAVDAEGADLDSLEAEARSINEELEARKSAEAKRAEIRKSVAAGAGVTVQDVNALIRQFEQMQKMMKQMMGNKRGMMRAMRNMKGLQ